MSNAFSASEAEQQSSGMKEIIATSQILLSFEDPVTRPLMAVLKQASFPHQCCQIWHATTLTLMFRPCRLKAFPAFIPKKEKKEKSFNFRPSKLLIQKDTDANEDEGNAIILHSNKGDYEKNLQLSCTLDLTLVLKCI